MTTTLPDESTADPTVPSKPDTLEEQKPVDLTILSSIPSNEETYMETSDGSVKELPPVEDNTKHVQEEEDLVQEEAQEQSPESSTTTEPPQEDSVHDSVEISLPSPKPDTLEEEQTPVDLTVLSSMPSDEETHTENAKDSLKELPPVENNTKHVEEEDSVQEAAQEPPESSITTKPPEEDFVPREEDSVPDSVEVLLSDDNEELQLSPTETLLGQSDSIEEEPTLLEEGEPILAPVAKTANEDVPPTPGHDEPSNTIALTTRSILRRIEESYWISTTPFSTSAAGDTAPPTPDPIAIPYGSPQAVVQPSKMPPLMLRMPNTAFGIALCLAGNSIMWRSATLSPFIADRIDAAAANTVFWGAGTVVGIMVGFAYLYKAFSAFELVYIEYRNAVRIHFMNAPHLTLIMLAIGVPEATGVNDTCRRVIWCIGFVCQLIITQFIYEKWMFSATSSMAAARPQYLLSTVGWFLLAVLGQLADIENAWGLALPSFCFGAGLFFYILVVTAVFCRLHRFRECNSSLALLMAPPSVGVVASDLIGNDPEAFSLFAEMLLGWCLVLVLLLFKTIGPRIATHQPSVFGMDWAHVFPLSALAWATVRYARVVSTAAAEVVAAIFVGLSTLSVLIVFFRTIHHIILCCCGRSDWEDPLVKRYEPDEEPSNFANENVVVASP